MTKPQQEPSPAQSIDAEAAPISTADWLCCVTPGSVFFHKIQADRRL